MWPFRRGLPADLRDALRHAERLERRRRRRRLPVLGLVVLLALAAAAGLLVLRQGPSLPEVIYGPASAPPPAAAEFTGRVRVIDGDTLGMGEERLRLHGIDAPELSQSCERAGRSHACGEEARAAIGRIVGRGALACTQLDTDRYGRRIVRCRNEAGTDIGAELVRQGWAVAFRRYSEDYVAEEAEARAARRGLWAGRFEDPSDWRARHR